MLLRPQQKVVEKSVILEFTSMTFNYRMLIVCDFRLGIALRHEEKRCGFLKDEIKIMVSTHDEVATR